MSTVDYTVMKRAAGYAAAENEVKSGMKIGIGSGSTVVFAAERIGERYANKEITDIVCIPTSFQAKQLIAKYKLPLGDLDNYPELDVGIDGADSIDDNINVIKGGGGACVQEKIVAMCCKRFVVISDEGKYRENTYLGFGWTRGLPVEVIPMAYAPTMKQIEKTLHASSTLRMATQKAGPVVTDNGNFILDVMLDWESISPANLDDINISLLRLAGVVHTGLFLSMVDIAYIAKGDGSVMIKKR